MSNVNPLYSSTEEMFKNTTIAGRPLLDLIREIQDLYLDDDRPWVIGFSGGKDSTTILSLIFVAISSLKQTQMKKHVYVISSDTLVETPSVVQLISTTLNQIDAHAQDCKLPISTHIVYPRWDQTFWVNLLGKGYPAPTQSFRWCTERMKIDPVSEFIKEKVAKFGEVVVVLGARSDESASRAQVIAKHRIDGSSLSRHSSLPGAYTYMPIEDWSFDDVWMYLLGAPAPWGGDHFELFSLYKDSNAGECPLVIDTNTPSCGNSRFGCWTCTVVTKDRAIEGLIESGELWLKKLKSFRNKLYNTTIPSNKEKFRNFKRRTGKVQYARGSIDNDGDKKLKTIPGPYLMKYRKKWLEELLRIEKELNDNGHNIDLIRPNELYAIRREWMFDPNEPDWGDSVPQIYRDVYGKDLDWADNDAGAFTQSDADLISELASECNVPPELVMKLLELEQAVEGLGRRKGLFKKMDALLNQDWGTLDEIMTTMQTANPKSQLKHKDTTSYDEKIRELTVEYESLKA